MSDGRPLSSDQIDRLFDAARTGHDLDARPESKPRRARRVRESDFSRPSKFSPGTQRRFESADQAFCRPVSTQLGAELRSVIELEVIDIDQLSFSAAIGRVPQPSPYGLVEREPLGTTILLATELTEIEMAIARRPFRTVIAPMSVEREELLGLTLHLREVELKLANVNLAPSSEPNLTITIEAPSGGISETSAIAVPYRAIGAAKERRSASNSGEGVVDPQMREPVQRAVSAAEIDVRVEAAAITLPPDGTLAFQPGDIVKLGTDAGAGGTAYAGVVPVHRARADRSGAKRAVELLDRTQHPA